MDRLTIGVEEEFQVVDATSGALVPRADELVARIARTAGSCVTGELNLCQVETSSPVCLAADDLTRHVKSSRRALAEQAAAIGLGVAALGTHPTGRWQQQRVDRSSPRFRRLEDAYQLVAREQIICGNHVHVGVPDPDLRVAAMTRLRPWLPVVLALSANSPFWQGRDSGFASYRAQIWRRWPTCGMPPAMATMEEHGGVVRDLVRARVVADASHVYWYARPSMRYPTIEVRVGDTLLDGGDTVALAAIVRALVWTEVQAAASAAPLQPWRQVVLDAAIWHASRYGVRGTLVSPVTGAAEPAAKVVRQLLRHVAIGLDAHGDRPLARLGVSRILAQGTGADRQRALFADGGDVRVLAELISTATVAA